jgi:beta-galactosidase/beta-glucuronidase
VDREDKGESLGWQNAGFDDAKWPATDPCMDTWFDHGIETYYGKVFYRTTVKVPAVPPGRKIFLWLSSTDGGAKVFVNGRHVPFVNEAGESSEWFPHTSYGKPAVFDITSAVKPGADNQVTIAATHPTMNELGSGGLIGPVFVYREKP